VAGRAAELPLACHSDGICAHPQIPPSITVLPELADSATVGDASNVQILLPLLLDVRTGESACAQRLLQTTGARAGEGFMGYQREEES
jgi:hypothetical protein